MEPVESEEFLFPVVERVFKMSETQVPDVSSTVAV